MKNTPHKKKPISKQIPVPAKKRSAAKKDVRDTGLYESFFESNRSIMLLIDPGTGKIVNANGAARSFYGYSKDDIVGKNISEINMMSKEMLREAMRAAFASNKGIFHFNHRLANGEIRNVQVLSGPVHLDGKDLLHSIIIDETDRVNSEWGLEMDLATSDALARLAASMDIGESLEEISGLVLDHAKKFTGSPNGFVGYLDPDTGYLVCPTMKKSSKGGEQSSPMFKEFKGDWGWVLENKKPRIVNSVPTDRADAGIPKEHVPIISFLGVPALQGGKLIGIVTVANAVKHYSESDVAVLGRLADIYSITIKRWLSEEALRKESNLSAVFSELSRALISMLSIDEISDIVADIARNLTKSGFGYAGYISPDTGAPVMRALGKEIKEACKIKPTDDYFHTFNGLWGWVLQNRHSLLSNDPANDSRKFGTPKGHIPINNFLSVPAMMGDKILGQVSVANAPLGYTEQALKTVERIADIYSIAIQRHLNEEALKQAAEEWATTFDAMPDKVFILDRNHQIVRANKAYLKLTGTEQDTIVKTHCYQQVHGSDECTKFCPHKKTIADGKDHSFEIFEPRFGMHFMVSTSPIRSKNGMIIGTVHVMRDVTAQKNVEKALRESLQTSSQILSAMPSGLFVFKRSGRYKLTLEEFNPEAENAFGQSLRNWRGRNFLEMWPSAGPSGLLERMVTAVESDGRYNNEAISFDDDYLARVFTLRAFSMPDDKIGVILENVTEKNRLAAIVENIRAGIIQFDRDHRVVFSNVRINEIFKTPDNINSTNILDYMSSEEAASILEDARAVAQGQSLTRSGRLNSRDKFLEYAIFPLLSSKMEYDGALLIVRDVTRETAEQQMVFQNEKLNSLAVMIAGVAHDLNNPLDGLQNCVRRLRQNPTDERRNAEYLDLMEKALVKMGHVIRQLIKFSRKESLQFEVIELPGIITDATRFAMKALDRPEVEVVIRIRQTGKLWVNGDITSLFNVFLNLLLNSYSAIEGEGRITISAEAIEGNMIEVIISDTGSGISPEALPRIFDPFFTTKKVGEGTGLGLSISRQAIIQHGGRIRVESAPGTGTRFRILLPAAPERIIEPKKVEGKSIEDTRR